MNKRLAEIIRYKTGGVQKDFAALLGWSPQYLAKLLKGETFGLSPVLTIIRKLPEVNARWLLLGEGSMLELDKCMLILSPEELRQYEQFIEYDRKAQNLPFGEVLLKGRSAVRFINDNATAAAVGGKMG